MGNASHVLGAGRTWVTRSTSRFAIWGRRSGFILVGTAFAMLGVTLGVAALAIVMSVTGGFQEQFREKVLGVNAHVLVLKYSIDFREYRDIMKKVENVKGVKGVAPFVINPMMVSHGDRTATGVLLKGVSSIPISCRRYSTFPRTSSSQRICSTPRVTRFVSAPSST